MNNYDIKRIRELAIELLDDEYGISDKAYAILRELDPHNEMYRFVQSQDGRFCLPESQIGDK